VELIHIATEEQAADGFTKPPPKAKFERWVGLLNLQPASITTEAGSIPDVSE
jgi:hypothetical protein